MLESLLNTLKMVTVGKDRSTTTTKSRVARLICSLAETNNSIWAGSFQKFTHNHRRMVTEAAAVVMQQAQLHTAVQLAVAPG